MERYENIDKRLHKELAKLNKKLENDSTEFSSQDLELADCLFHALKSEEGYYGMIEGSGMGFSGNYGGSGYGGGSGNSYARGRDSRGRYTSREMAGQGSYYSGHYPPMGFYPESYNERW